MDPGSPFAGTRLFDVVQCIEDYVTAIAVHSEVTFAIGKAELPKEGRPARVVVVPVESPMAAENLGNYGTRVKRTSVYIFESTEAAAEALLENFIRGAVETGIRVEDLGPERPRTEEDDAAGLTKRGPVIIFGMAARFDVDVVDDGTAVPFTGINASADMDGPGGSVDDAIVEKGTWAP